MADVLTWLLTALLVLAVTMTFAPHRASVGRLRAALRADGGNSVDGVGTQSDSSSWPSSIRKATSWLPGGRTAGQESQEAMTLAVQQMAALLKGGRSPARLWEELMLVHSGNSMGHASFGVLSAAHGAARLGSPVAAAIRNSAAAAQFLPESRERRVWFEIAACLDIADASGCPLAGVLTRLAAQLEVEDDAEAARQSALAGPKSTVTLLSWLPLTGLVLGIVLGVDPLAILLGTPAGVAALLAGLVLATAGRVWSARLVRSATRDHR